MIKSNDPSLPNKNSLYEKDYINEFFQTMFERQEIWYKRNILKSPYPWTKDEIFKHYRFCNAYRELDHQSQWLIKNIILKEKSLKNKLFQMMIFRIYNRDEVFDLIGMPEYEDYNGKDFLEKLIYLNSQGIKVINKRAYTVNTFFTKGESFINYTEKIIPDIHRSLIEIEKLILEGDVKSLIKKYKQIIGIGRFISHEWFVDVCYLFKYLNLKNQIRITENDFTAILPGSNIGLRLLFPSTSGNKNKIEVMKYLLDMSKDILDDIGEFKYICWDKIKKKYELTSYNLTLHTMEFWLCEYQKYWRIKNNCIINKREFKLK